MIWTAESSRSGIAALLMAAAIAIAYPSGDAAGQDAPDAGAPDEFALPNRPDHADRIIAAVSINGRGPFRFMLDTGASRTVIASSLLQRLDIALDTRKRIRVVGVSGTVMAPSVHIDRLAAGTLHLENVQLAVLSGRVLDDVDGILGMDGFADQEMSADFVSGDVTIAHTSESGVARVYYLAQLKLGSQRLLVVDAFVGRVRTKAIIDTGGTHTLGNRALLNALNQGHHDPLPLLHARIVDATEALEPVSVADVPPVRLGGAVIVNLPVTFGDFHVFETWGLQREPTLLIGMDVLGSLSKLNIDYRRREMHMLPRTAQETAGSVEAVPKS